MKCEHRAWNLKSSFISFYLKYILAYSCLWPLYAYVSVLLTNPKGEEWGGRQEKKRRGGREGKEKKREREIHTVDGAQFT